MSYYTTYLYVVFIIKSITIFLAFQKHFFPSDITESRYVIADNIFNTLMSFLIIYLFHPFSCNPIMVDQHTKLFLCTFAVLTLVHTFTAFA